MGRFHKFFANSESSWTPLCNVHATKQRNAGKEAETTTKVPDATKLCQISSEGHGEGQAVQAGAPVGRDLVRF